MSSLQDFDVNDLDFTNMGSWPTPVKGIAGLIVFVLVLFLGYQMFVSDDIAYLETEVAKEFKLKQDFEEKQGKAVHLEKYREQMVLIQSSFETLLKQLPQSSEVAGLVDEISYAATGAGLEISMISLREEVDKEIYLEQPINIEVAGGYHQLAEFVSRVSNMPRIVTLHDFEIKATEQDVFGSEGEKMLVMKVSANTYRYDDTIGFDEGGQ